MNISKQSIAAASIILFVSTLASNGLGIVREMLLAKYFGTSRQYDLFVLAQYLPSTINAAFLFGIPSVFAPLYHKIRERTGQEYADEFQRDFFGFWILIGVFLTIVGVFLTSWMVKTFFGHLIPTDASVLIWATQVLLIGTLSSIVFMILRAILLAHKHFLFPAIALLVLNISVITTLLVSGAATSIENLVYATVAGMLLQSALLFEFLRRQKQSIVPKFIFFSPEMRESVLLAIPVLGIEMLWGVFYYFDGYFASFLGHGKVSVTNYAMVLFRFPNILFGTTIAAAILPSLSESFSGNKLESSEKKYLLSLKLLFLICLLTSALFIVFGREIVGILFGRGLFDKASIETTYTFLAYLSPSCFFLAGYPIVLRLMSATRRNRVMMLIFVMSLAIKYILFTSIFYSYDLIGLALSIDISFVILFSFSLGYSHRIIRYDWRDLIVFVSKNAVPAIILIYCALLFGRIVFFSLLVIITVFSNWAELRVLRETIVLAALRKFKPA